MSKTATTMKLSKKTLDILKNFSTINPSIYVEEGNRLYTVSALSSIAAEATIDETFDSKFCIYELTRFLGVISLFQNPEFEFEDKYVTIYGQNNSEVKYHFCQSSLLDKMVKNYGKTPNDTTKMYKFSITSKQIDDLIRASSVLQLNSVKITQSEDEGIDISVFDKSDASANVYTVNIADGVVDNSKTKSVLMNIDLLKLMPGDYDVEIGQGTASKWINKSIGVTYYIIKENLKD